MRVPRVCAHLAPRSRLSAALSAAALVLGAGLWAYLAVSGGAAPPDAAAAVCVSYGGAASTSGLGDRMMDLFAACAFARLSGGSLQMLFESVDSLPADPLPHGAARFPGQPPPGGLRCSHAQVTCRQYDASMFIPPPGCALVPRFAGACRAAGGPAKPAGGEPNQDPNPNLNLDPGSHAAFALDLASAHMGNASFTPRRVREALRRRGWAGRRLPGGRAVAGAISTAAAQLRLSPSLQRFVHGDALAEATCVHLRRGPPPPGAP